VEFIRDARQRGLKLALATAADRIKMQGNLAEIGIPPETFNAIVMGEDVTKKKPDPQVFLLAAQRLGLEPAACLVIEDAVNGVKAGKSAGARVLGITSTFSPEQLKDAGADEVAPDLAHVPAGVV
jgi:HAD superfamily hydrolase (TIGR01509 family)